MKTSVTFFILMLAITSAKAQGQTQSPDPQWYVNNGECISNQSYINCNSNTIEISGVAAPDTSCDARADDDLFVIYNDGSFSLTRGGSNIAITNRSINLTGPDIIKHLYWTNIYDQDDPPQDIVVGPTNEGTTIPSYTSDFVMLANHTVKPGSDITLVINNSKVGESSKLYINEVIILHPTRNTYSTSLTEGAFTLSPIFDQGATALGSTASSILPDSVGAQYIDLTKDGFSPFTFINLRAGQPLQKFTNSAKVVFRLESQGVDVDTSISEPIQSIHDPNEIFLKDICKQADCTTALYEGFFYNTSTETTAKELAIEFNLPDALEANSIVFQSCTYNGSTVANPDSIEYTDNKVICYFDEDLQIRVCPSSPIQKKGYVEFSFCATVKKEYENSSDLAEKLTLSKTQTIFNSQSAPKYFPLAYGEDLAVKISDDKEFLDLGKYCTKCRGTCYQQPSKCIWCLEFFQRYWRWIIFIFAIFAALGLRILTKKSN